MTSIELLQQAQQLSAALESYAMVTVARVTAPSSATLGAQAIVKADGSLHGWIGGGCAKSVVISAALEAIRLGTPKIVRISNDQIAPETGIEMHRMACASDGGIELFIHPHSAMPLLLVLGATPLAMAAREFASRVGFRVTDNPADAPQVALVATQGEGDDAALVAALASPAARVLMIASPKKAASLRETMQQRGISKDRLDALEAPAGPDIGSATPAEIALAAVAGVIAWWRGSGHHSKRRAPAVVPLTAAAAARGYVNPVCGVIVDPSNARHTVDYGGDKFYFCCDGCKQSFDQDPQQYAAIQANQRAGMSARRI